MFKLEVTYDPQTGRVDMKAPFDKPAIIDIMLGAVRRKSDEIFFAQLQKNAQSQLKVVRGVVNDRALRQGKN